MHKIIIITTNFGKFPKWFDFYLQSCSYNPTINWLIATDNPMSKNAPKNVRFVNLSFKEFRLLVNKNLKIKVNLKNPYKICDLKPTYGIIFKDYIKAYDFWGHSDIDLIYGNIRKFITEDLLSNYEIITSNKEFTVGQFTLYKNNKKINNIYKKNKNYKSIFKQYKCCQLDEKNVIKKLAEKGKVKAYFNRVGESGFHKEWDIIYKFKNGKLFNCNTGKELLCFHFLRLKDSEEFLIRDFNKNKKSFYISSSGIGYHKKDYIAIIKKIIDKCTGPIGIKMNLIIIQKRLDRQIGLFGLYLKKHSPKTYRFLKKMLKNEIEINGYYLSKRNSRLENIFNRIYKKNIWPGGGSGLGSRPENTVEYRRFLQDFIKEKNIKSVLDAGCGDWQFSKLMNWNGINYIGIDIVKSIIKNNKKKYTKKNIHFILGDFLKLKLPKADLIIVKDVLMHLSNINVLKFLPELKKYKYVLLINNFTEKNTDCDDGRYRPLNLNAPPFNLNGKEVMFYHNKQALLVENPRC